MTAVSTHNDLDASRSDAPRPRPPGASAGFRARLARALDPALREAPGLSPLNIAVCGAIGLSLLLAVLNTEPTIRDGREGLFLVAEAGLTMLLALEYGARVWVSVENPAVRGRLSYIMTPAALLDLVAVVVVLAPVVGSEGFLLRLAMLLRMLRLAKLGRFSQALRTIGDAVTSRAAELWLSLAVSGTLLLLSSAALYLVEGGAQPDAFGSIPRAMWWSVATLTTVGYGDVTPITPIGRVLAAVTALGGIGLIAMPTGILASAFSDAFHAQRQRRKHTMVSGEAPDEKGRPQP